jgi:hypothetical protein
MKRSRLLLVACFFFAFSTLPAQMQFPPSQRELNGYLLGQDAKPLSEGFDSLIREQKYSDGWIERVYSLDTAHSAFMVFGFSDSSDDCLSIQITGEAGTSMRPFLGLRLGDTREKINEILGLPTQVQHLAATHLEFLQYRHRNYTVELDSLGNLWSIRILGYRGFPENPPDSLPELATVFQSLRSKDPEIILEALAPDAELIVGDSVYTFAGSAFDVVSDPSSRFAQLLYSSPTGLASLDRSFIRVATPDPASLSVNVPKYEFPPNSPVEDVVFVVHAGKWRIWEARLAY